MKNLFTIVVLCVFSIISVKAQTDVSGAISENTTWDAAGSPYTVTSSVTVANGATLTIESDVTVRFNDNQFLYVNGSLIADNVVFTSSNLSPAAGNWGYIQIGSSSHEATATISNSQIQYARSFYVYYGTATLTNTNISNFSQHGVELRESQAFNMTGGSISGVGNSAIYLRSGSSAVLNNVDISNAVQNGILLATTASIDMTDCSISSCEYPVNYAGAATVTLNGVNNFSGNTNNFIHINFSTQNNDMVLPTFPIPIHFLSTFTVNAGKTLEIGSNNVLKFEINRQLQVHGTFIAVANEGESIYFTSVRDDNWGGDSNGDGTNTSPAQNNWYGVAFYSTSDDVNSIMKGCKIRYSGGNQTGGITITDAGPTIDNCEISNSYFGIKLVKAANPTISNTTIGSSQVTPVAMSFEANPIFNNNSFSFSNNQYDAIGLLGGTLTSDANIIQRSFTGVENITYIMLSKIIVPAERSLTIQSGVVIKSDGGFNIVVYGTLTADGEEGNEIVFTSARDDNHGNPGDTNNDGTSTTPAIGNFGGIFLAEGSSFSSISNAIIKYARAQNEQIHFTGAPSKWFEGRASIIVIRSDANISNNEISNADYGIWSYETAEPSINNNRLINIVYTPFGLTPSSDPTFSGNTFTNCGWVAVGLIGGEITINGTIKKRDIAGYENITYVLLHHLTVAVNTYIDIEPGVVIKIDDKEIIINGGFKADGTEDQKIVFTSTKDDNVGNPGDTNGDGNATSPDWRDWRRIRFTDTSDDTYNLLNNCIIRYGGDNWIYRQHSNLEISNASPVISNSLIEKSHEYGIKIAGNSAPVIDNVIIQNCGFEPIGMSLTSDPTFNNMEFIANRNKGLRILEGTLSSDATLISRDVAGITNIAYIVGNLTVAANATLTINPGVVIKMEHNRQITVDGAFIANGTETQKIVFTSIKDDSAGGDTNDDGNDTSPSKGDWYGIKFRASGLAEYNSLTNSVFRYGRDIVEFESSYALVENCIIELSSQNGIRVLGSSNPLIRNNEIYNITYTPIQMSMFANPVFEGNSLSNIGIWAIGLHPETYSQDGTMPQRNFAGFENITYYLNGEYKINSGTTITIPAGTVFKTNKVTSYYNYGTARFNIDGTLLVEGTAEVPVVFTHAYDDNFGNPKDTGNDGNTEMPSNNSYAYNYSWFTFNDISNDASKIEHALIKSSQTSNSQKFGIRLISASPTISDVIFENLENHGITMSGVSEPHITNCTFHNLASSPMDISLVAYPATTENNIISGKTPKFIRVRNETLTQDVLLPKRNFGGINNIPYLFHQYNVGTGAVLTIEPGVICKFHSDGYLQTYKGLIAQGGSELSEKIVFTSIADDFYGGDSNSDGTTTLPGNNRWRGIAFQTESIDPSCIIDNSIIRYTHNWNGYQAIVANNASPTITNTLIQHSYDGVKATGSANPVINNCDFLNITNFGVNNVDQSFVIGATNCWWGNNSGPTHSGNPEGTGVKVTNSVDYNPYAVNGMLNPILGDVSLNGAISAYDASFILQNVVGSLTLNERQEMVADVSQNGTISAFDASLVLQYAVGLINFFEPQSSKKSLEVDEFLIAGTTANAGETFTIPLIISASNVYSFQTSINFDPEHLSLLDVQVSDMVSNMNRAVEIDENGEFSFAAATTSSLVLNGEVLYMTFKINPDLDENTTTFIYLKDAMINEDDISGYVVDGEISVKASATSIKPTVTQRNVLSVFPNPANDNLNIKINLENGGQVRIEILSISGQSLAVLANSQFDTGEHTLSYNVNSYGLQAGIYLVRVITENAISINKLQIIK